MYKSCHVKLYKKKTYNNINTNSTTKKHCALISNFFKNEWNQY